MRRRSAARRRHNYMMHLRRTWSEEKQARNCSEETQARNCSEEMHHLGSEMEMLGIGRDEMGKD
ncbi:HET-s/LopB domain-containing protein [Sesbania bispinosa]|nr:HET-s/LopB domain-containing protein [Sesbania bispinosa]